MTCRHALTENQFTQVETSHTNNSYKINSMHYIYRSRWSRKKNLSVLININDREMTFEKIIRLCCL